MMAEAQEVITFTFRVEFVDKENQPEENPFRIFSVPESYSLADMARVILEQFDREFNHSYGFFNNIENWKSSTNSYELFADIDGEDESGSKSVKNNTVKDVFQIGSRMVLLYDYGEEWRYIVEMIDMDTAPSTSDFPIIEDAFGKVPGALSETKSTLLPDDEQDMAAYYDMERKAMERVAQIFGAAGPDELPDVNNRTLETFYDYLIRQVKFPYDGVFQQMQDETAVYHNVVVEAVMDPDDTEELDRYGLICLVEIEGQKAKMPMSEIVINQGDPNYDFVEDYCIWFWNNKNAQGF